MAILKIRNENGEVIEIPALRGPEGKQGPVGPEGPQGVSGVYTGSGEMPEGYDVQIDPNGDDYILCDPIEKTENMTTPVGIDEKGKLWTVTSNVEIPENVSYFYDNSMGEPKKGAIMYIQEYANGSHNGIYIYDGKKWCYAMHDITSEIGDRDNIHEMESIPNAYAVYEFVSSATSAIRREIGDINSILATLVDGGAE